MELESLRNLRPTADVEGSIAHLKERAISGGGLSVNWESMAAKQQAMLDRCIERDRIQSMRPEGCTCLGTGEVTAAVSNANDGPRRFSREFCLCPEGVAAKAEYDAGMAEVRARDVRSFIDRAGIPPRFYDFAFENFPGDTHGLVDWTSDDGQGLFIHGEYGTGKTSLAVCVLKAHIERYCVAGNFVTVPALLDEIRATYRDDSDGESALMSRVTSTSLLVLDDIGAERPTEWVVEKLFTVINYRHDHLLPTVFTSNLSIPQLAERLGERTTWRIVEMSEVIHLKGPNLRDHRKQR